MATTAPIWVSEEAINEEGIIDYFQAMRGFGYIAVDAGSETQRYWFHFGVFPDSDKDLISVGKRVIFSAEGGQKLGFTPTGQKKWPRVSKAKILKGEL